MHSTGQTQSALRALAAALHERRTPLLDGWRGTIDQDPSLPDTAEWTEEQLLDHFPDVLDGFERTLAAWPDATPALWRRQMDKAQAHARYRWLQGYSLRTIAQEWSGLNRCVLAEIARFFAASRDAGDALADALQIWASVLEHHLVESVIAFDHLQQAEAATRAQELADTLRHLRELHSTGSQALSAATDRMRDSLSVAQTSVSVMSDGGLSDDDRTELHALTQTSFDAVRESLSSMAALSRLEAGAEQMTVAAIDAGAVIANAHAALRDELRHAAVALIAHGPDQLPVEGDALRISLVLRHLVLTALPAVREGAMTITWGEDHRSPGRWFLSLAHPTAIDGSRATSPTALALSEATRDAHRIERSPKQPIHGEGRAPAPVSPLGSDGMNLAIAKRLCELLHASLEMEATDEGLQYRVTLPKAYAGDDVPGP
jgi:hypothetical protein